MKNRNLEEQLRIRPVDPKLLEQEKKLLLNELRAYRLRELREASDLTQTELATKLQISQNRVSKIEHGAVEKTQVDTLRRYAEAIGGTLRVEVVLGDHIIQIA